MALLMAMVILTMVQAGKWISRFLTDSRFGTNYFCHTLIPNVTLDFSRYSGGNAFQLELGFEYLKLSPSRRLIVHDKNEMPLLRHYGISMMPEFKLHTGVLFKGRLETRRHVLTKSRHNPCNDDDSYSENRCNVAFAWKKRLSKIKKRFGAANVTCVIPGLIFNDEDKMPVCEHYEPDEENPSVGIKHLITIKSNENRGFSFITPVIGSELPSDCLKRCDTYEYNLITEETDESDVDLYGLDAFIYFASNQVEIWTTSESYSFVSLISNVGGLMGLLLGASVFSLIGAFIHFFDNFKRINNTSK